jgi:hypothetical protein
MYSQVSELIVSNRLTHLSHQTPQLILVPYTVDHYKSESTNKLADSKKSSFKTLSSCYFKLNIILYSVLPVKQGLVFLDG